MKTKFGALALSTAVLLSAAACSKKDEPVTPAATTAAAGGSTTTTAAAGTSSTTAKTDDTKKTTTTKGDTDTTKKTGSKLEKPELSTDEETCLNGKLADAGIDTSTLEDLDKPTAVTVGASMVACVAKPKLGDLVAYGLQKNAPDITDKALKCVRDEVLVAEGDDLALFLGAITLSGSSGDDSLLKPFAAALGKACGFTPPE